MTNRSWAEQVKPRVSSWLRINMLTLQNAIKLLRKCAMIQVLLKMMTFTQNGMKFAEYNLYLNAGL